MSNEKTTPCGKYIYYSWGISGSKSDNKILYDNCKNYCKEKVCLLFKKEKEKMYITANRITQNCISVALQDKITKPKFREFIGYYRRKNDALIVINRLRDLGHIYIGNNSK
jgi:hypothetical protein